MRIESIYANKIFNELKKSGLTNADWQPRKGYYALKGIYAKVKDVDKAMGILKLSLASICESFLNQLTSIINVIIKDGKINNEADFTKVLDVAGSVNCDKEIEDSIRNHFEDEYGIAFSAEMTATDITKCQAQAFDLVKSMLNGIISAARKVDVGHSGNCTCEHCHPNTPATTPVVVNVPEVVPAPSGVLSSNPITIPTASPLVQMEPDAEVPYTPAMPKESNIFINDIVKVRNKSEEFFLISMILNPLAEALKVEAPDSVFGFSEFTSITDFVLKNYDDTAKFRKPKDPLYFEVKYCDSGIFKKVGVQQMAG